MATLATALVSVPVSVLANVTPAAADSQLCLTHSPATAEDFQSITDARNSGFGIGDMTSAVQLPDGRRFFTFGDTGYYNLNSDGSAGPMTGFGNNSAWVQSGNCFTLLFRTGAPSRSWVLPPQQDGSVYWPGGSVVVGSRLYVFMQRMLLNTTFGTSLGSAVAEFDLPSLNLARITPIPWMANRVFGPAPSMTAATCTRMRPQMRTCAFCFAGDMYVARVPESQIMLPTAWRYSSRASWVTDVHAATAVLRPRSAIPTCSPTATASS